MYKCRTLGVATLLAMSVTTQAVTYDVAVGYETSAISGVVGKAVENNHSGLIYKAPKFDLGLNSGINGPLSAFARVSTTMASEQSSFAPGISLESSREVQAQAGFAYKFGATVVSFAPVVSIADYTVSSNDVSETVGLQGLGLSSSVDIDLDRVGVRFHTQYIMNNRVDHWADSVSELNDMVGGLGTNVTKVGVCVFGSK
ncbi:hypothetical protein MMH89_01110 [Candidatus Comchoanobacter bicostacola]|uniref:Outer membrane protein beta-barrel domain-containing protein n=1 Tax=Candidatus Comchoanobacter bicostacola TaxID=2919598 RepID=A0ABY5DMJ3_9GAMM|nr:hypothetical protein [Candidatus Comchoanobacter bicostacola]UTC24754.1 hypothetical protein MMH89_01110 [Candidatus Comchoanobacter bicostacola]